MNKDAWKRYDKTGSWFYEIHDTGLQVQSVRCSRRDRTGATQDAPMSFMRRRTEIARAYNEAFKASDALQVPILEPGVEHAWHLYVLRLRPDRAQESDAINSSKCCANAASAPRSIASRCTRCITIRSTTATATANFRSPKISSAAASRCPIYAAMSDEDVAYVIETVAQSGARKPPLTRRRRLCEHWLPAARISRLSSLRALAQRRPRSHLPR